MRPKSSSAGRAEVHRELAHARESISDELAKRVCRRLVAGFQGLETEEDRGQRLTRFIVELAGDAFALDLPERRECGKRCRD